MSEWSEVAKQYLSLAAPYVVPPIALLFATFLFKFILANKKTRQYAKMLMNVLQGQLESSLGAEKSKQVLELWNEIVKETEQTANSKSKTYSENYFITRMRNEIVLSDDEERELAKILVTMNQQRSKDGEVVATSDDEDNYKLPVLPCPCEL